MSELKIDDVAKQSGLTKRTIRYYEQIGLMPAPPRSEGGFRLYTEEHVEFLKKITNAKEVMGFSLTLRRQCAPALSITVASAAILVSGIACVVF